MRPHNWSRYSFGAWLEAASERLHPNKLAVALANKLARIAWSVLRYDKASDTHLEVVARGHQLLVASTAKCVWNRNSFFTALVRRDPRRSTMGADPIDLGIRRCSRDGCPKIGPKNRLRALLTV